MRRTRPRARARSGALLVGLGVAAVVAQTVPAAAGPVDVAEATLVGASAATALFASEAMVPGDPHTRCLDVALPTPADPSDVLVRAVEVSGDLAPYLRITVEVGPATGAPEGSCTGFAGTPVWVGTLAELAALSSAEPHGATTGWAIAGGDGVRAFRFTVEVADVQDAQGLTATADLVWAVVAPPVDPGPTPTPTPTSTPTPTPTPTSTPTPTPTATSTPSPPSPSPSPTRRPPATPTPTPTTSPEPTAEPTTPGSDRPGDAPTGSPGDGPGTTPPADGNGTPGTTPGSGAGARAGGQPVPSTPIEARAVPGATPSLLRLLDDLPVQVTQTVIGSVRQAGFPGVLLGVVGIFLLLQDMVDRRDPKLALAPLDEDDGLAFDEEPTR